MTQGTFTKGLHDIGNGCYAWLQPDGSWGLSNAGLVVDGGHALLVDTLMDNVLTREMLDAMRASVPAARKISTIVNTHGNPDHYFGNDIVGAHEIVATAEAAREMAETKPEVLNGIAHNWQVLGEAGEFFHETMGQFRFHDITLAPPTRTFEGTLNLTVGAREVRLIEVGPAHTAGDLIAYLPKERVVFTGDILFVGSHPIVWAGPVANWVKACDTILGLDVDVVVPGHGPITDKAGVQETRDYFVWLAAEARKRFDAGMSHEDAARDLALGRYSAWLDAERIVPNIHALYAEFAGKPNESDPVAEFAAMARWRAAHRG